MKKLLAFFTILCSFFIIQNVEAGTLSWKNFKRISSNTFEFYLEASDLDLNYVSGTWEISHGKIIDITMHDGWINKSGINNTFYYYRNGIKKGNYKIATVKIRLTSDSKTSINYLKMGTHTCYQDAQKNYFDPNGNITDENGYKSSCFSSDATLSSLAISDGVLTPNFESHIENYQATVDNSVTQVSFLPILTNSKAKIISGKTCNLSVGINTCQIITEAENGTRKTYTVKVTRKNQEEEKPNASSDATLKSLTISHGNLFPEFRPSVNIYSTHVENKIDSITFTPILNHNKAKILSNNTCELKVGENICQIVVEAENKKQNIYKIYVTREKDENNDEIQNDTTIKDLIVKNGILKEEFDLNKKEYTIDIDEDTDVVILQYTFQANNLNYTIPFEIKENTTYIELIIHSLNNQKTDTYRFNLNKIKKDEDNTPSTPDNKPEEKPTTPDTKPSIKEDEIDNPQTGILFNSKTLIVLAILAIIGILCFKKKNIIPKL